jgi:hypothetical protein
MSVTRRRFLAWSAVLVAACTAGAWLGRGRWASWLAASGPGGGAPGPLDDATADTLDATVRALLHDRVEPSHYREFFRWRAEHLPGARALYRRFAGAVDVRARRAGHRGFRSAPADARRAILTGLLPARGWTRVRRLLVARDDERFARQVVREIFRRFARTDAWVLAGYDAWPGMPRAIATLAPPGVATGRSRRRP